MGEPVGAEVAAHALGLAVSEIDGPVQAVGAGRLTAPMRMPASSLVPVAARVAAGVRGTQD